MGWRRRTLVLTGALALGTTAPLAAQRSDAGRWGIEAIGATLGSAAGAAIGVAVVDRVDCGEDLYCVLGQLGLTLTLASAGAAGGDLLVGNAARTEPSVLGAAIGALVGAGAGLATTKLYDELVEHVPGRVPIVLTFTLTQGSLTALGSRIGAALR